jgi:ankyrin repeat protein
MKRKYLFCLSVLLFLPADIRVGGTESSADALHEKFEETLDKKSDIQLIRRLNIHIADNDYVSFRELLSFMKRKGVDLNTLRDYFLYDKLPLMAAAANGREAMIEDLVKEGADPTAMPPYTYKTVLHYVMENKDEEQLVFIADLLLSKVPQEKRKKFINGEGSLYVSPLCKAIRKCRVPYVRFLIQQGVDVNRDVNGVIRLSGLKDTALHEVCRQSQDVENVENSRAIVRLLIRAGADAAIRAPFGGNLPIDFAKDSKIKKMLENAPAIRSGHLAWLNSASLEKDSNKESI